MRIRKSFRLRWRLPRLAVFWLLIYSLWMGVVVGATPGKFFPDTHQVETAIVLVLLSAATLRAVFSRDAFARLFFGLVSGFLGSIAALYLYFVPMRSVALEQLERKGAEYVALFVAGVLVVLLLAWHFLIRPGVLLLLSVIPVGIGRSIRQQVRSTLAADAVRRTVAREGKKKGAGRTPASLSALVLFLTLGMLLFIAGQYLWGLTFSAMAFENAQTALMNGGYLELAKTAPAFQPAPNDLSWSEYTRLGLLMAPLAIAGLLCLMAFAFLWHRWQRSKIFLNRAGPNAPIPPDCVLLMRHSKDEVMRIPKRVLTLMRLPFMLYELNYTFEELIGSRLSFVGPMASLDTPRRYVPMIDPLRDWLKRRAEKKRHVMRWLQLRLTKLRRRLQIRFPSPGGSHFRSDNAEWTVVIDESLPKAKAVVLIIGEAKNGSLVSPGLQAEMNLVKEHWLLDKCVFLMPPLLFDSHIKARWKAFCDYLPNSAEIAGLLPRAKRVLGVCFADGLPIVITGSQRTEFHYQSVLDLAGTLAGDTLAEGPLMVAEWRPKQRAVRAI